MGYKRKAKKSLLLYYDYLEQFELLNDEQLRKLIYAMIEFDKNGAEPELDKITTMAFVPIKRKLIFDKEEWEKMCEKNKENANKRWGKKDAMVYDRMRKDAKYTDIDIDIDIDTDIDTGSVNNIPPHHTDDVFHLAIANFGECEEVSLRKSCDKFFKYYEKKEWQGVKNWEERLKMWIDDDISQGKIKVRENIDDRIKRIFGDN